MAEIVNVEMAAAWNGDEGRDWVREQRHFDAAIGDYTEHLLAAAAIAPTDRVLDVGCGNGATTRAAARAASKGTVVGADISSLMLDVARRQSADEDLGNVTYVHADVQVHPFDAASFDVGMSRFGVMFFGDPPAAFANIAAAIRPGGRVAFLVWQGPQHNEWVTTMRGALAAGRDLPMPPPGSPGPMALADADRTRGLLEGAGFSDVTIDAVAEPFHAGTDVDDAFGFLTGLGIARNLVAELDAVTRERALADLRSALEARATADGVTLASAAWIVAARR